jgi:hypothetical protein
MVPSGDEKHDGSCTKDPSVGLASMLPTMLPTTNSDRKEIANTAQCGCSGLFVAKFEFEV